MADRLFRGWTKQPDVADRLTDDGEACEHPGTTDDKLKPASGVILGVCLGMLAWALIGLAFWR